MGVEPPFIYDKPSAYTFGGPTQRPFNPRAATQASWSVQPAQQKKDGPLIDFNRHPDSYVTVPYGNLNVEPMHPQTKTRVNRSRNLQLFLRVCGLLGAMGLMFCIITINKTSTSVGWILRVGPAFALCHTVYGIYHLARPATSRPPASTASYQLFAGLLDAGIIPFFAFSAYMAHADYTTNSYGWDTLFNDDEVDYKVIFAFFLICVTEGGLFLLSLVLDIYLAMTFRRIASLPPDMNPLEDNLTARPRHKRNKSEMVHDKHLSGSTLASQRYSVQTSPSVAGRRVPFMHSRTDSADKFTIYGNQDGVKSRVTLSKDIEITEMDPYKDQMASSQDELIPSRPQSAIMPSENARSAGAGLDNKPFRSSGLAKYAAERPASWLSFMDYEGVPVQLSQTAQTELDGHVRPITPLSFVSGSSRDHSPQHYSSDRENWYQSPAQHSRSHLPLAPAFDSKSESSELDIPSQYITPKKRSREPLGMNPPTPVNGQFREENASATYSPSKSVYLTPQRQALQETDTNSSARPSTGSRPASFLGGGGKSRYYGNLRTSVGGSPVRTSHEETDNLHRSGTMRTEDSGNVEVYASDSDEELEMNEQHDPLVNVGGPSSSKTWNGSRQVSNSTGYDLQTGYAGLDPDFGRGMGRRREVSGKVAEEGRGFGGLGASEQKDGGVVTGQSRNGAAGWARFKGL